MINMTKIIENKNMFDEIIKNGVTLVDFYADWCRPCKMIAPIIQNIAEEFKEVANVCKVDIDVQKQIALDYGIRSIPTLIIFKNGEIFNTITGYRPKEDIIEVLNEALNR